MSPGCVSGRAHLSGLQFPDGGVAHPLQSAESTLQLSALPLRDGGVIHSLGDTAQGQSAHRLTQEAGTRAVPGSVHSLIHKLIMLTSERTPTSLEKHWAVSRQEGAERPSLADSESTS